METGWDAELKHNSCGARFVVLTILLVKTTIVAKTKSLVPSGLHLKSPPPHPLSILDVVMSVYSIITIV